MSVGQAEWDAQYAIGLMGEGMSDELFRTLLGGNTDIRVEVKTQPEFHNTGNLYVEYQQGGPGNWRQSGIGITEADMWNFVLPKTGVMLVVPIELVREEARRARDAGRVGEAKRKNDMPTRGALVRPERFIQRAVKP